MMCPSGNPSARSALSLVSLLLLALAALPWACIPAAAQVAGATLSGTVSDASGAVIPNARISIKAEATGVGHTAVTDAAGFYSVPNLSAGTYDIEFSAQGFATEVRRGLVLTVGEQQLINVRMAVGQTSQRVEVQSDTPPVELSTSSFGASVNSQTIRELPLNGRDWTQLATLQPGVASMASLQSAPSSNGRGNRGYGTQLTISGGRPQQNNYRIDGISVNDMENSSPGSVLGVSLGVDAIQEFSIVTSNYSAEYGRTSGGVINAISRSGTNQFHGSAYEFIRNSALDARNYFDGPKIPPFKRNQFGASGGGPIQKDRTFFFADYEGLRQSLGLTRVNTVPTADARNGIIHNTDGTTTNITVDPLVVPFLDLWAQPNGATLAPGNTGIYSVAVQQVTNENFWATKFDHVFSSQDSMTASFQRDTSLSTIPDALNTINGGFDTTRYLFSIEETHIFTSHFINSARFGFNRAVSNNNYGNSAINPLAADPSLGAVPGMDAPMITVPGITTFNGGLNAITTSRYHWNSFQGYDDAFVVRGRHSLKFGFAVERMQENYSQINAPGGQFRFNSLVGFLTNQPVSFTAQLPTTSSPRYLRQSLFAGYVQDDLRWKPNLTINLGLRYEMSTEPTEKYGRLSALQRITDPTPHLGGPLFANPTLRNFEPRVGFAWDPFSKGKTSVRGGFGMFDVLPLTYEYAIIQVSPPPFAIVGSASPLPSGSFPTGAFSELIAPNALRQTYIDPNPPRNYVMQWNFSLEHEIVPTLTAMLGYIGSRGVHQPFRADDIDTVLPTLTPQGYLWPSPAGSGTKVNPAVGRIDNLSWTSDSFYDGFLAQVTKRVSHGLQLQGSYTWSKSIDEGSGSTHGDPFGNSISSEFYFDPRLRRGLSDFNIAHNAIINYIWDAPSSRTSYGPVDWVLGGWQVGGILQMRSGLPFTPMLGGDPLGLRTAFPISFPNHLYTPGCGSGVNSGNLNYIKLSCFTFPNPSTLLGNTSRNSIIGPGLVSFDFSLFKNNYIKRISETFNIQFRAELFNILNHPNFNPPLDRNTLFDATGNPIAGAGVLTSTSTTARDIQFAIKVIW